ncbi:unnamed protein product [Arctogadus glacialis]
MFQDSSPVTPMEIHIHRHVDSKTPASLRAQLYLRLCSGGSALMVETHSGASETAPNQRLGCVMSAAGSATQVARRRLLARHWLN